jgi:hypothetical protein
LAKPGRQSTQGQDRAPRGHWTIGHTGTAMHESAASAVLAASQAPTRSPKPTAVHLVTLGCARNEVDSEELAARLERNDFRLVADPAAADALLVNTCGFIEAAKKDSRCSPPAISRRLAAHRL